MTHPTPTRAEVEALAAWSKDIREKALAWMRARDHLSELYKAGDDDPMSDDFKAADLKERFAASNLHTIMNCHELIARLDTIDALLAATLAPQEAAALEVEARVEDMREACARIAREGCLVPPDGGSPTEQECSMCEGIANSILLLTPSPARFMRLLEAARSEYERAGIDDENDFKSDLRERLNIIHELLGEALGAFPQPEEKP